MKTIGILTSGGDAPGMNAVIRAVVRTAAHYHIKTMGIRNGYQGVLEETFEPLNILSVHHAIQRGGTMLGSARCLDFKDPDCRQKGFENLKKAGVDGLVVIGGDGSFMGAKFLSELGMPTIGIPGTIDNDLAYTDYTIGFHTAMNTVVGAISSIRDTASSHRRSMVVEVMGRHCGSLALHAGVAAGAEVILIPEEPLPFQEIVDRLKNFYEMGKHSNIVVVTEGTYTEETQNFEVMARKLSEATKLDVKPNRIGYIQRGGAPVAQDRLLASRMGYHAVRLLINGISNRVVGISQDEIFDEDIQKALKVRRRFDFDMFEMARILSGDSPM